jgi:hypothetical protein
VVIRAGIESPRASGLVYGLVAYIFVAGLIRRDRRAIAASCSLLPVRHAIWGVLPIVPRMSWGPIAAALIGLAGNRAAPFRHSTARSLFVEMEHDEREDNSSTHRSRMTSALREPGPRTRVRSNEKIPARDRDLFEARSAMALRVRP